MNSYELFALSLLSMYSFLIFQIDVYTQTLVQNDKNVLQYTMEYKKNSQKHLFRNSTL